MKTKDCPLCSSEYPADFVETIMAASATVDAELTPEAFRQWLVDDTRESDS